MMLIAGQNNGRLTPRVGVVSGMLNPASGIASQSEHRCRKYPL